MSEKPGWKVIAAVVVCGAVLAYSYLPRCRPPRVLAGAKIAGLLTSPMFHRRYFPAIFPAALAGHIYTIVYSHAGLLSFLPFLRGPAYARTRIPTPDPGGHAVLDIATPSCGAYPKAKGTILVLPGLTSSSASGYVQRFTAAATRRGWRVAVLNARGCVPGEELPHDAPVLFSAATISDVAYAVAVWWRTAAASPAEPLCLVGFSLGGNVLVRFLAACAADATTAAQIDALGPAPPGGGVRRPPPCGPVVAAATVCNPMDLAHCARHFSATATGRHLYDPVLAQGLRQVTRRHAAALRRSPKLPAGALERVERVQRVRDYDAAIVVPMFGYDSVADYYARASSRDAVATTPIPLLVVEASDDPVTPPCMPVAEARGVCAANGNVAFARTAAGGHLGFPRVWAPLQFLGWGSAWCDDAVCDYLDAATASRR